MRLTILGMMTGLLLISTVSVYAEAWQPTKQDEQSVVVLASRYFALIDSGNYAGADVLRTPSAKAVTDPERFAEIRNENLAQYGAVTARRLTDVWWYPKGSREGTGVAAAVDFLGQTEKGAILCGYLAVIELTEGEYRLQRDETTFLAAGSLAQMTSAQLSQFLNVPGCRRLLPNGPKQHN